MKRPSTKRLLLLIAAFLLAAVAALAWSSREQPQPAARVQGVAVAEAAADGFVRATGPAPLSFPADYGPHDDYQTEWWYYTGNLEDPSGRHFGFQFTIFRRALQPPAQRTGRASDWAAEQVYMGHFAVTDVAGRRFRAFERFSRGAAGLAGAQADPYRVWLEDWQVADVPGRPGVTRIQAAADGVAVDLTLTDRKGPVLQGDRGYSQKAPDPGNASYYYSLTRLVTEGTVTVDGRTYAVRGLSWKDHEYSTSALAPDQVGWDWFALQLDDGTELKVFHIRRADGSVDPFSAGSFVDQDAAVTRLARDDFQIAVLDTWRSPRTGAQYPSRWRVIVPGLGLDLTVEPWLADQELNVSYAYWEGAVRITGARQGRPVAGNGYVEMTGYAGSMQGQF
ncbi:MAG: carotenoid 1,2-hydratase [Caldilineales bacterium]|nr:carotenoid 1,2-hydratase [Caldilineales bacterium]